MKEPPSGSNDFRKLNPHLFAPKIVQQEPCHNLIRQSSKPLMNQLETQFLEELRRHKWQHIMCQSLKFRLGNGVWYTPDFITSGNPDTAQIVGWEIKGKHVWEDSIVKLKVVSALYPLFQWRLAHKNEAGQWGYQLVFG